MDWQGGIWGVRVSRRGHDQIWNVEFPTSWTMELTQDSKKFHLKIPMEFHFTENQSMESFDFVLEGTWRW